MIYRSYLLSQGIKRIYLQYMWAYPWRQKQNSEAIWEGVIVRCQKTPIGLGVIYILRVLLDSYKDWSCFEFNDNLHCVLIHYALQGGKGKDQNLFSETFSIPFCLLLLILDWCCLLVLKRCCFSWWTHSKIEQSSSFQSINKLSVLSSMVHFQLHLATCLLLHSLVDMCYQVLFNNHTANYIWAIASYYMVLLTKVMQLGCLISGFCLKISRSSLAWWYYLVILVYCQYLKEKYFANVITDSIWSDIN